MHVCLFYPPVSDTVSVPFRRWFLFLGLYLFSLCWGEKWAPVPLNRNRLKTPVSAVKNTMIARGTGAAHFTVGAGPLHFRANNRSVRKPQGISGDTWHFQTCHIANPSHIQFRGHSFSRQFCRGSHAFSRAAEVSPRSVFTWTGWLSKLPLPVLFVLMQRKWQDLWIWQEK